MSVKLLLNNIAQEPKKRMWIGYIPMDSGALAGGDPVGDGVYDPVQLTQEGFDFSIMEYGINANTLIEMDPQEFHTYDVFVPESGYTCIVLPEGWNATFDNGQGGEITFAEADGVNGEFAQDGMMIKELINGVQYYGYGLMFNVGGTIKLHVNVI